MKTYDMIVIGTGSANIILEAAREAGLSCAQVERHKFGGTCLNRGCIPTKVLTTAADRVYEIRESAALGLNSSTSAVDWSVLSQRVWAQIDANKSLRQSYLDDPGVDVYEGTARFTDNHTVVVDYPDGTVSEPMTAEKIYIGVGGRTKIPDMEGLEQVPYLTSERLFGKAWPEELPKSIIVVGGGAIGCEFAHIFAGLGSTVTLVQHNVRLLPKEDEELSAAIRTNLELDGITMHFNKKTPAVRLENGQVVLTTKDRADGHLEDVRADVLFICPGIRPNSDWLDLEKTDIAMDERGWIRTNEFLETSVPGVYAFGDINGRQQFRHKANYEADILAHNHYKATSPDDWRWARYDLVPAVTFTHPEVAHVGLTEKEARDAGYNVQVGYNRYADTAKGFALGFLPDDDRKAFAKLIIDRDSDRILGFHAIGPFASTLVQPFNNLLNAGTHALAAINEDIASDEVKALREKAHTRTLDPHKEGTVRETMVAHPSLNEVGIWTYYDLEQYQ